jgi:tetratricopeptide (TPR) repeat protein
MARGRIARAHRAPGGPVTARRAGLALLLLALGASACSRLVILNDPLSAEEHNDLGVVYEREGRSDLAEREYRRALRSDPALVRARVNLGNLEAGAGRWKQAAEEYRRALRVEPSDPDALNNLAHALLEGGGDLEEAERHAERAVAAGAPRDSIYRITLDAVRRARAGTPGGAR